MPKGNQGISRRTFIRTIGGGAAAAGLSDLPPNVAAAEPVLRPNLLILQPDQHRGTGMRCAGDTQAITPNLDRLAAEGVRFTNCASSGPVCSPFRGTFQTGLYPHKHRVVGNNIRMDPSLTTFAEVFVEPGYATGYIGKWHLDGGWPRAEGGEGVTAKAVGGFVPPQRRQGWQEWHGYEKSHEFFEVWKYDEQGRKARVEGHDWEPAWHTDMALDFIRRQRDGRKPWLYYVAYGPPHLPEQCPKRFLDMYDPATFILPPDVEAQLPEERKAELRRQMQMYYAQTTAIDHEVGRVIEGLKRLGVDDNTIILYTSDHGDKLGSHSGGKGRLRGKGAPYATAFRIPLIVRWPKKIPPRQVCEALVSSVDLAPTVLELADLSVPKRMQGHSMVGWCLGEKGYERDAVYLALGDNRPRPPESVRPSKRSKIPPGMKLAIERPFPAGPGLGKNPKLMQKSRNWDCGYDELLVVDLPPGRHKVMVEQRGKGRMEVEYTLGNYVEGQPRFRIPTSKKYCFKKSPENQFVVSTDGRASNPDSLRPHLYGYSARGNPPVFILDCRRPAQFEVRVSKSVGDKSKKLRIYVDGSVDTAAPARTKRGGWWRAIWDGRYVYRPGKNAWLYDHQTDPYEMKNLIDSPEHAQIRERLGRRLLDFAGETEDVVLPELRGMLGEA